VDLLHQSGIPKDVLIPVVGGGQIGSFLVSQKDISGIFFTGSKSTGEKIAKEAAGNLVKLQEELGGKDPVYICDDVDIPSAVASTADGAFYNSGQSCCSVERIYIHSKIYDEFVAQFLSEVEHFALGPPDQPTTYIGPLTRLQQLDFLEAQVKDAISKGAKLLLGGRRTSINGKGYYFEPTVLKDVNSSMDVMREESFGPIIGLQKVENDSDAIEKMNDSEYGLTAGVYTKDKNRAIKILKEINSGTVYWNCCDRVSPPLPWSGRKSSGLGLTLSTEGIKAFLQPKAWHLKPA